jgi:predicted nucleic acid-binding protein
MAIADLDRALGTIERALLDSSTLLAYHAPHKPMHPLARHLIGRIAHDDDPLRGCLSVVSFAEILVRPHRVSHADFTYMHDFVLNFPNLILLPMDATVAVQAATIRASMRLSLPDAMVVAAGLLAGCEAIVSNDARWKQRGAGLFPQFRWIYLSDYL